jgi:hypothetical protein
MGRACGTHREKSELLVLCLNLKRRYHLAALGVRKRVVLK